MVSSARQVQEKSREQQQDLSTFIDLCKGFDTERHFVGHPTPVWMAY